MDVLSEFFERGRLLIEHHVSDEVAMPMFIGAAIALLVAGLGVAVLGAKLARLATAMSFGVLGAGCGLYVGRFADVPAVVAALVGAGLLGVAGYSLHRLWVGLVSGWVLILALNATYGAHTLGPQVQDYASNYGKMPAIVADSPETFTVPEPSVQAAALNPEFTSWVRGLWDYTYEHDRRGTRRIVLMSVCVGLFGLLIGLFAPRLTLVTMTSLVGTAMFSLGALGMAREWQPDFYQAGFDHPQTVATACGTFLLGSLILQTLLTRPHKPAPDAAEKP